MIAASGGRTATASSASRTRHRRHHLEAGVAEDHPQRAEDLGLVVADQDALARAVIRWRLLDAGGGS